MLERLRLGWGNGARWKILGWAMVIAFMWAVAATVLLLAKPSTPDPFGPYPVQSIDLPAERIDVLDDRTPGVVVEQELPVIEATTDGRVPVTGVKCIEGEDPVDVVGEITWRMVHPRVEQVPAGGGGAVRSPGCETFAFSNRIPVDVVDAHAAAGAVTVWQITGVEEADGAQQAWVTENFALVSVADS